MTPMRLLNTWNSLVKSYSNTEEIAAFLKRNGIEVVDHSNSYRPTHDILSDIQTAWARASGDSKDKRDDAKEMKLDMEPNDFKKNGAIVGGVLPQSTYCNWFVKITPPAIERVIFSDPATVVFWADGSKTVVKCQGGDLYDPEKGLMAAMLKKLYGNNNTYNKVMRPFLDQAVEEGYFL